MIINNNGINYYVNNSWYSTCILYIKFSMQQYVYFFLWSLSSFGYSNYILISLDNRVPKVISLSKLLLTLLLTFAKRIRIRIIWKLVETD